MKCRSVLSVAVCPVRGLTYWDETEIGETVGGGGDLHDVRMKLNVTCRSVDY